MRTDDEEDRHAGLADAATTTRVWTLGSGSGGNAVLVEHGESRVLLDAGFEIAEPVARIRAVGVAPATIDDVVLTHGHRDHVLGAGAGARIYGWRVWATLGTLWHWRSLRHVRVEPFEPGDTLELPPFRVRSAATPHDIGDSAALVLEIPEAGARIGYCTDLGSVPEAVRALLLDLDLLIVEANHDERMLATGPYGPELRARVAGDNGHLSNSQAAALVRAVASARLRHVVLAHLSRHNNTPDLALAAVVEALRGSDFRGELAVAPQDVPLGPLDVPTGGGCGCSADDARATLER